METAYIETSVRTNPLGKREAVNHKWVGKSPYVRVSLDLIDDPSVHKLNGDQEIQIGPYRLLRISDHLDFVQTYVRADKFGALRVALYKSTRLLDLIYRRLIITLAVWNLADFSSYRVPTWQDIKILKRFAK